MAFNQDEVDHLRGNSEGHCPLVAMATMKDRFCATSAEGNNSAGNPPIFGHHVPGLPYFANTTEVTIKHKISIPSQSHGLERGGLLTPSPSSSESNYCSNSAQGNHHRHLAHHGLYPNFAAHYNHSHLGYPGVGHAYGMAAQPTYTNPHHPLNSYPSMMIPTTSGPAGHYPQEAVTQNIPNFPHAPPVGENLNPLPSHEADMKDPFYFHRAKCACVGCRMRKEKKRNEKKIHYCAYNDCDKKYSKSSHLKAHYRLHMGERPFICVHVGCNKTFTRSDELTRHARTHSGEKRYHCDVCGKGFIRSDHRRKHVKIHLRDKSVKKPVKRRNGRKAKKEDVSENVVSSTQDVLDSDSPPGHGRGDLPPTSSALGPLSLVPVPGSTSLEEKENFISGINANSVVNVHTSAPCYSPPSVPFQNVAMNNGQRESHYEAQGSSPSSTTPWMGGSREVSTSAFHHPSQLPHSAMGPTHGSDMNASLTYNQPMMNAFEMHNHIYNGCDTTTTLQYKHYHQHPSHPPIAMYQ